MTVVIGLLTWVLAVLAHVVVFLARDPWAAPPVLVVTWVVLVHFKPYRQCRWCRNRKNRGRRCWRCKGTKMTRRHGLSPI